MTKTSAMRPGFLATFCLCLALGLATSIGPVEAKTKAKLHHKHLVKSLAAKTSMRHPKVAAASHSQSHAKDSAVPKEAETTSATNAQAEPSGAQASSSTPHRAATLAEHRKMWAAYIAAQAKHRAATNLYWKKIDAKRVIRKRKLAKNQTIARSDYVLEEPPLYKGSAQPVSFFKVEKKEAPKKPATPRKTLPVVADFVKHASAQYGFTPRRTSEIEFKRRYAREALARGLSKEQVVRLYAFETGGYGSYDMQAGFDEATGKVYPVSTALGYAQLLNANSVSEVATHGDEFADRLERLAKTPNLEEERMEELRKKAAAVRAMFKWASSESGEWNAQVRLSSTPKGQGVHALNIDADVGPWLQVSKLIEIKEFAARKGMRTLTAAQLELMNLAGPGRGFEMMQPHLKDIPTANFFERAGYERNPVTNHRTGAELLTKIEALMEKNLKKNGAQEFVAAFDKL
jgi:hypothetical protein